MSRRRKYWLINVLAVDGGQNAQSFDLVVGRPTCATPISTTTALAATSKAITGLTAGNLAVCVTAKDAAGNTTVSSNNERAQTSEGNGKDHGWSDDKGTQENPSWSNKDGALISNEENRTVGKVLNAAALTYVAATISSVVTLLYYLNRYAGNRR